MGKRIFSLFCVLTLCLMMLPTTALGADTPVSYLAWDAETNSHVEESCDNYTVVTAETVTWDSGWYVVNANNLWINARIEVQGDVSLILMDDTFLNVQGIHVGSNSSLTIYGQTAGTGRLIAKPGRDSAGLAVIGGNEGEDGGTIAIHGGNINVQSYGPDMDTGGVGAGIGGGANGAGGTIIITGGMIRASGKSDLESGAASAAIGGGSGGDSGTISIFGGQIDASSRDMDIAGIGSGSGGVNGTISITGGYFYEGDLIQNTVSGVQVAQDRSVILQNIDDRVWYMVTDQVGELNIIGGTEGADYTRENGVITVLTNTPLTISGNGMVCKERIVVNDGVSGQLTISNVNIFTQAAPLEIPTGSSLFLTLEEENILKASVGSGVLNRGSVTIAGSGVLDTQGFFENSSGIDNTNAKLVIEDGVITADGGSEGAGIGGGDITIHGGTVTAKGYWHAAGIGGSVIEITGGSVVATGDAWGPGISGAEGTSVKISGGKVTAKGGTNAGAGIGGFGGSGHIGHAESGGTIEITGGIVTATSRVGAGIGGGGHTSSNSTQWGDGGTITISGGVVTAYSQYGAAIGGGSLTSADKGGAGGDITISGGTVTATSGREGVGIGGGSATDSSGSFSTGENGHAVIITTVISDHSDEVAWNGIFFEGNNDGKAYGTQVSPQEDFTVPEDKNLVIDNGKTVTIPEGVVATNNGTITIDEGSLLVNNGVLINNGTIIGTITGTGVTVEQDGTTVTIEQGGNTVTVTLPEEDSTITVNDDGSIILPGGSTVTVPDGAGGSTTITMPENGGVLDPSTGEVIQYYAVTFDSKGGSSVDSIVAAKGSLLTKPENPIREGYTFTGWFKNEACTVAWNFASDLVAEDTTLYAGWKQAGGGSTGGSGGEEPEEQTNPFTDVVESDYYYDAVLWAVANDVTEGTSASTFSPDKAVTRGQMVTFLWRAYGSPEAAGTNPFTDVSVDDYYYDAVLWAAVNGVTEGTSASTFNPDASVSRAQAITFQWRAAGAPEMSGSSFGDVDEGAYYADAVAWAVKNEITNGTGDNTFSPNKITPRAQAVTFLWRELA